MTDKSKAEQGAENARRLQRYIEGHEATGTLPTAGGRINKSRVAEDCGFSRSVFSQNPVCKALILDAEKRLASRPTQAAQPQQMSSRHKHELEKKVSRLEARVATLSAENADLHRQLSELKSVIPDPRAIGESGRMPW